MKRATKLSNLKDEHLREVCIRMESCPDTTERYNVELYRREPINGLRATNYTIPDTRVWCTRCTRRLTRQAVSRATRLTMHGSSATSSVQQIAMCRAVYALCRLCVYTVHGWVGLFDALSAMAEGWTLSNWWRYVFSTLKLSLFCNLLCSCLIVL